MSQQQDDSESLKREFVTEPMASLYCPICQELFTQPVLTQACGHSFCSNCIRQALTIDAHCPMCRKQASSSHLLPNLILNTIIRELKVYCPNRQYGCQEMPSLESVDRHVKDCGWVPTECLYERFGCEFTGKISTRFKI
jgi:uncharacterized protein (UPF0212 family)